jgi:hypothetical protein
MVNIMTRLATFNLLVGTEKKYFCQRGIGEMTGEQIITKIKELGEFADTKVDSMDSKIIDDSNITININAKSTDTASDINTMFLRLLFTNFNNKPDHVKVDTCLNMLIGHLTERYTRKLNYKDSKEAHSKGKNK